MTDKQFDEYLEQIFDSFCKKVIKRASISIRRHYKHLYELEVPLDDFIQVYVEDTYDLEFVELHMDDYRFRIKDVELAAVISSLPIKRKNVILMSFFLEYNDSEIARFYDTSPAAIAYRKECALKQMREMMDGLSKDRC